MMWVRGPKEDYDRWSEEYGCEGWDYESVLPHFRNLENCSTGQQNKTRKEKKKRTMQMA